jgi:hypothetical protein
MVATRLEDGWLARREKTHVVCLHVSGEKLNILGVRMPLPKGEWPIRRSEVLRTNARHEANANVQQSQL